jgi:hypothetical protein
MQDPYPICRGVYCRSSFSALLTLRIAEERIQYSPILCPVVFSLNISNNLSNTLGREYNVVLAD